MKCHQNPLLLMEYAEGALRGEGVRLLREHLSSCAHCRRELDSWRQLESALQAFPVVPEPVDFNSSVMGRIRRSYARPAQAAYGWLQLAMGAGVSFLVVGVLALAALVGTGIDNPALWAWWQQGSLWVGLYLQDAYPNLLAAGWLLMGAMVVAFLAVASSSPHRRA